MEGYGLVSLVNAELNVKGDEAGDVEVHSGMEIVPKIKGRTYFADACSEGSYNSSQYTALKLLGKRMKYIVDLSGAGCGCNVALYLTSLAQNQQKSDCLDFYCDANSVCGVSCAEIDIQEANEHAWHSTLHTWDDGLGVGGGYGGNGARTWNQLEYGPGGKCIDTTKPFEVAASFPIYETSSLKAMEIVLSQDGHSCPLSTTLSSYQRFERDGMAEMSKALADGMTPIISYWSSNEMLWMDGLGADHKGPCSTDDASACGESVKFYNFSLEYLPPPCTDRCPYGHCDRDKVTGDCTWFTNAGEESYHCKVETCDMALGNSSVFSGCWSWEGVHYFSIRDKHYCHHRPELPTKEPTQEAHQTNDHLVPVGVLVAAVVAAAVAAIVGVLSFALSRLRRPHMTSVAGAIVNQSENSTGTLQVAQPSMQLQPHRHGGLRPVSSRELLLMSEPGDVELNSNM